MCKRYAKYRGSKYSLISKGFSLVGRYFAASFVYGFSSRGETVSYTYSGCNHIRSAPIFFRIFREFFFGRLRPGNKF
jgi:hypothetical protein